MDSSSVILKYLKRKKWVFDGTEYVFRNPRIVESNLISEVDCILPKKGQSYTRLKFSDNLQQIVNDTYNMFDSNELSAFEIEFYVDGEVAEDTYLSSQTKSKIREKLKEIYFFSLSHPPKLSIEVAIFPNFTKKPDMDSESIIFPFFWDLSNITINGVPVKVNPKYYNDAKGYLENRMLDNDFATDVADKFYEACEPDFKLKNTNDIYISATGYLRNIDGINEGQGNFGYEYSPKYFQKIT